MLPDLERLIQLQEIESRASIANKAIAEAPGRIAALDALLQTATASLAAAKHTLEDNKTSRRSIDKDLIAAQQRQEKYKEQLMAVKTNDEYHAMQHQIKAVGDEVGQNFAVTRERIRQIEAKALRKLRHPSRSRKLRAFLEGRS